MKVITLTLSPAFDVHCHIAEFKTERENLATVTSRDAGGKGINISRALSKNGIDNVAVAVLGKENANEFCDLALSEGIALRTVEVDGRIRENITVHTDSAAETRISFAGFGANDSLLARVSCEIEGLLEEDCVVTLTGRIPEGISFACVKSFAARLAARGVKLVIDSKSFSLEDLIECKPYLIKPNEEEISEYFGIEIKTVDEAAKAAKKLHLAGIENAMITLGGQGAVLASRGGVLFASAPTVEVRSTIGAGDSTVAGFLAACAQGLSLQDTLRLSVAYGSAACMTEGTQAPAPCDVARLYGACTVTRFE